MKQFTDAKGDVWRLSITIGDLTIVESETGCNLLRLDQIHEPESDQWKDDDGKHLPLLSRLALDVQLTFSVIYALLQEQLEAKGVDPLEFGRRMTGEASIAAEDAFWGELTDFFRQRRQLHMVTMILKQRKLMAAAMEKANQLMESFDEDQIVNEAFGKRSTERLESSELIPGL